MMDGDGATTAPFGANGAAGQEAQLLRAIMENSPMAVWAIDTQGTFTFHDGKGLDAAGLRPGQYLGKNIFDLYPRHGTDFVRRALAGEQGHSISEEHGIHWESWVVPIRDDQGGVVSVAGLSLDITQAKAAEQALRTQLDLVEQQQAIIRVLSTPIIEVWDQVLTLPMVGVLDSARAATVMEELLSAVVQKGARFAILDLTGVEVVDTKVAAHLISIVSAVQLVGAEGIIAGIRPTVAQTVVTLGLDLTNITTCANLKLALKHCLSRMTRERGEARPRTL